MIFSATEGQCQEHITAHIQEGLVARPLLFIITVFIAKFVLFLLKLWLTTQFLTDTNC
jgi:hypothetical protein